MSVDGLIQRHVSDHRRVSNGLQVHQAVLVAALELHNHEPTLSIQGQEVDAAVGLLPVAEFFGDDEQPLFQKVGPVTQHPLQVVAFIEVLDFEGSLCQRLKLAVIRPGFEIQYYEELKQAIVPP